jgi:hypothetical protein
VTAKNSEGEASRTSERVVVPAGAGGSAPENLSAPTVSGQAALGAQLTCSEGAWSGSPAPTITYQWLRDGTPIASALAPAYTVVEADQGHVLSCNVAATNNEGVASKTSNLLEIPGSAPEDSEAPQVAGTAAVGEPLTCLKGAWTGAPAPTFTYQWLRNGVSIPSATAPTYILTSQDRGRSISCKVTAQNSAGTLAAISSNAVEVPALGPQNASAPEISGEPTVGQQLSCSPGTWVGAPAPAFTYQWLLDGTAIPAATASTFTVANADRGLTLYCEVTASNGEGSETATSKGIHIKGARPEDIELPQISGSPTAGQPLTCLRGIWNGQPPPSFAYQWLRDGTRIASATSSTYTVELADQGHLLSCLVTATNSEGRTDAESKGLAIFRPKVGIDLPAGDECPGGTERRRNSRHPSRAARACAAPRADRLPAKDRALQLLLRRPDRGQAGNLLVPECQHRPAFCRGKAARAGPVHHVVCSRRQQAGEAAPDEPWAEHVLPQHARSADLQGRVPQTARAPRDMARDGRDEPLMRAQRGEGQQ